MNFGKEAYGTKERMGYCNVKVQNWNSSLSGINLAKSCGSDLVFSASLAMNSSHCILKAILLVRTK